MIDDNKYLGFLCKYNHEYNNTGKSLRYKRNGHCFKCATNYNKNHKGYFKEYEKRDKAKLTRKLYRETHKEQKAEYQDKNKELIAKTKKLYYDANREKTDEYQRQYYKTNRAKLLNKAKQYQDENGSKCYATKAKHRAKKRSATVQYSDSDAIKRIYRTAHILSKMLNRKFHVDHIIPLSSSLVCGFHHEGNLRIISAERNLRKGCKFTPIIQDFHNINTMSKSKVSNYKVNIYE